MSLRDFVAPLRARLSSSPATKPVLVLGVVCVGLVLADVAFVHAARRASVHGAALCEDYEGVPDGFGEEPSAGMVAIPAGRFELGSMHGYADERPTRMVEVAAFHIDRTEVTNAQFLAFVEATHYVTTAERRGGSAVFHQPTVAELEREGHAFWSFVEGADFRHPGGPETSLEGRENEPVVQVSFDDALAYARWLGRDLPTEIEWEYAARAGLDGESLHRAPRQVDGRPGANFWQGEFPIVNSAEDGFAFHAPVGCFPPNGFGLVDTIGNVWEWTADRYVGRHDEPAEPSDATDCRTPESAEAPAASRVLKGGSFLCASNACARYRVSARHPQEADMPAMHVGFRTVRRE